MLWAMRISVHPSGKPPLVWSLQFVPYLSSTFTITWRHSPRFVIIFIDVSTKSLEMVTLSGWQNSDKWCTRHSSSLLHHATMIQHQPLTWGEIFTRKYSSGKWSDAFEKYFCCWMLIFVTDTTRSIIMALFAVRPTKWYEIQCATLWLAQHGDFIENKKCVICILMLPCERVIFPLVS